MVQDTQSTESENEQLANVHYVIDPAKAKEQGRSLEALLLSRRCSSCRDRIEGEGALPPAKKQMEEIAKCCANVEGFLRPGMPLRELVFRLLLKRKNQPMSLNDLHYALTEDLALPTHPMNITVEALKRILDGDQYYGSGRPTGKRKVGSSRQ